ncbi:MAG: aminotransferase class IV [Planctomycetota bacterium]
MAWVYCKGELSEDSVPILQVSDRTALYGDGLFETMFAVGEHVAFLSDHLSRLYESARALRFNQPWTREEFFGEVRAGVTRLLQKHGGKFARVRLTLSRGTGVFSPSFLPEQPAVWFAVADAYDPVPPKRRSDGWSVGLVSFPRNERSPIHRHKTCNYLENLLGREEGIASGYDEMLFLNLAGRLCEGTTTNLFVLKEQRLITPPLEDGILPGVARGHMLLVAEKQNLRPLRRSLNLRELMTCDEAFLTNSIIGVMPITRFMSLTLGDGKIGKFTKLLCKAFFKEQERSFDPNATLDDLPF